MEHSQLFYTFTVQDTLTSDISLDLGQELLWCGAIQRAISPQSWRCVLWNKLRDGY